MVYFANVGPGDRFARPDDRSMFGSEVVQSRRPIVLTQHRGFGLDAVLDSLKRDVLACYYCRFVLYMIYLLAPVQ